jgi:hypothetical protein
MKRQFFFLTFILACGLTSAQSHADSLAVEKACRDYVEGWATGDAARVEKAVSPDLVKRTIGQDKEGNSFVNNMSASLLLMVTRMNREGVKGKDLEPGKPFALVVKICDLTGDYALVKASNTKYGFFDYCQLARYNNEWKIINVLWGYIPKQP